MPVGGNRIAAFQSRVVGQELLYAIDNSMRIASSDAKGVDGDSFGAVSGPRGWLEGHNEIVLLKINCRHF